MRKKETLEFQLSALSNASEMCQAKKCPAATVAIGLELTDVGTDYNAQLGTVEPPKDADPKAWDP